MDSICFCKAGEATKDIDQERFLEYRDTIRKWGYYLKIKEVLTHTTSLPSFETDTVLPSLGTSLSDVCFTSVEHGSLSEGTQDRQSMPKAALDFACDGDYYIHHHRANGCSVITPVVNFTTLGGVDHHIFK